MLEYIKGTIASLNPAYVVVDNAGIGYMVNISLPCYDALLGKSECRLYIHMVIREDAWTLFGFIDEAERALFRALIGVSGVGANTARMLLSALPVADLEQAIVSGDVRRLKSVKGVGAKTAERIIVDLKDKIKTGDSTLIVQSPADSQSFDEALSALVMLGFPRAQSHKVLTKIYDDDRTIKVEAAIKKALTMM